MRVLLISNKDDITTDFIVKKLTQLDIKFYRFNTEELARTVHLKIDFEKDIYCLYDSKVDIEIDLSRIKSVYYRRPEIPALDIDLKEDEAKFIYNEMSYTLEGIYKLLRKAFWISPLYSIREAENKIYQMSLAKEIGFELPNSIITNQAVDAQLFFGRNNNDCIIKPIKSGLVGENDGLKVIFTNKLPQNTDFSSIVSCPTYIQSNIHKKVDIRVTIVGNEHFTARIHSQSYLDSTIDWRKSETILEYSKIELPLEIKDKCMKLINQLGLKFGAIDFIENENGNYIFLEINPNGQWAWIEQQLKYDISGSIVKLLINECI